MFLSILHIWLCRKACGPWNSKNYNRICGDDLIAQFTPREYERYCALSASIGLSLNKKKSFINDERGFFKEKPFIEREGFLIQVDSVPLRSFRPLGSIDDWHLWVSTLSELVKGKAPRKHVFRKVVLRSFGKFPSLIYWPTWAGGWGWFPPKGTKVPKALCVLYTISHNYGLAGLAMKPIGDPMDRRWSAPMELATKWLRRLRFAPIGGGVRTVPMELSDEFIRRLWSWALYATAFKSPETDRPPSSLKSVRAILKKYSFVKPLAPSWEEIYNLPSRMSLTYDSYLEYYPLDNFLKGAPTIPWGNDG
jgi:hypothetical protein